MGDPGTGPPSMMCPHQRRCCALGARQNWSSSRKKWDLVGRSPRNRAMVREEKRAQRKPAPLESGPQQKRLFFAYKEKYLFLKFSTDTIEWTQPLWMGHRSGVAWKDWVSWMPSGPFGSFHMPLFTFLTQCLIHSRHLINVCSSLLFLSTPSDGELTTRNVFYVLAYLVIPWWKVSLEWQGVSEKCVFLCWS